MRNYVKGSLQERIDYYSIPEPNSGCFKGTYKDNFDDMMKKNRSPNLTKALEANNKLKKEKTHCIHDGHLLSGDNLGITLPHGYRYCKQCKYERDYEYYHGVKP